LIFGRHWKLLDSILAPVGVGITGAVVVGIAGWTAWKYREQLKIAYQKLIT
jgi:hypothetical protein